MTMRKPNAVFLLLLTGSLATMLTGCWYSESGRDGMSSENHSNGTVNISKMGGGIDVADAPHGARLSTMGGDVHVGHVDSFAKISTMGGNVTVDHATGSVDASTMGGVVIIKDTNGAIKASTMGGDVTVQMVGTSSDRRDIDLSSKGGTIQLTVPKDFPMDVRIKLAYTNNGKDYRIIQHAGLNERESPDWDNSFGTPRKYILAAGQVGNGQNHVTIETINGDVVLRQE